jgi:hypothetical protein
MTPFLYATDGEGDANETSYIHLGRFFERFDFLDQPCSCI